MLARGGEKLYLTASDATPVLLERYRRTWPELRVIRLRANSGHQAALSAGLARSRGSWVATLDADLQDPPEVLREMLQVAKTRGVDVVYGTRTDRSADSAFKRRTARAYYRLMRATVGGHVTADAGDFRLMSRATVDAVNSLPEHHRVLRLVIPTLAFPSAEVGYRREPRAAGTTHYPLSRMIRLSVDSLTGFSIVRFLRYILDELLRGMIVQSGNDASVALAELVGGTEAQFVQRMNQEAARLGMTGTRYANATGLSDAQHYSTAADLAKLAQAIVRDHPEHYPLYSQREYRYNNITQPNRNRLLWTDPYVDGMKTGHTETAGWCLIASAKRGERRLVSVVLGAASDTTRAAESQKLLNFGFQAYDTVQLYQSGRPVSTLKVWKGAASEVNAGFVADRHVTLPRGRAGDLKLTLESAEPLVAPVQRGQRVGIVKVTLDGRALAEFPLIALDQVGEANLFVRAWHSVRLWFK